MMHSLILFSLGLLLVLPGCQSPHSPKTSPTEFKQNVMTIDYRILVGDPLTEPQIRKIQQIIQNTFEEIDAIYNKWNPNSELSRLNALPAGVSVLLSPQLALFMQRIDALVHLSEGRFDPTIEPVQRLWKERLSEAQLPSEEEIQALKPCVGWHTIHINEGIFSKEDSRTQLDFGGIAKGLAVDLLVDRLEHAGFNHLYVEWGGEIRTLGKHPANRPWRIYISNLGDSNPLHSIAELDLENQAIATSGDYFQYWTVKRENGEDKIYCHIYNPLTMTPLEVKPGSVASASLLAKDCVTADALAKVLMLFDTVEEAQEWFERLQLLDNNLSCWISQR